ncbi:MAG: hypothetical protein KDD38_04945 [Bdellovibrionales bacterium]|nr:hypothetical protein [Bdellovibrionales bacterium]
MTGFLSKLFGKKEESANSAPELIHNVLEELLQTADLDFSFEVTQAQDNAGEVSVELFGGDEELLRAREGQLLDAIQLFLTRVVQHRMRDERVIINVDNEGYREQANQELVDLAEKLKNVALDKGKPVYFRALAPRDRKVIHQYLAEDGRVKSRSIGEGLYKKIKIFPTKGEPQLEQATEQH